MLLQGHTVVMYQLYTCFHSMYNKYILPHVIVVLTAYASYSKRYQSPLLSWGLAVPFFNIEKSAFYLIGYITIHLNKKK